MRSAAARFIPFLVLGLIALAIPAEPPAQIQGRPYAGESLGVESVAEDTSIFFDASDDAGIDTTRNGTERLIGQAWGDIDQDGWSDLYVTDPDGPNILYHNQGDGTFMLLSASRIDPLYDSKSSGAVFGDYDNDGLPDLYVLNRSQPNVLFHNDGGLQFTDVTASSGVGDPYDGKTAAWGDYDGDGRLDLYVANWSCYPNCARSSEGDPDALFHNLGDGTFQNVSRLLGAKTGGGGFVASFVDFDNDGDADIYLVNDVFINERGNGLWRNDGPGCGGWCFTELSKEAGADARQMGMGLATTDYDNDGDLDLYFSNAGPMMLLENMGDGHFQNVSEVAGVDLGANGVAWGTVSLDYDNDGYQDLYLTVTDILPANEPLNQLFHNMGDGTFERESHRTGIGHNGRTIGVASADYNRDGWVDIVIGDFQRGYTLFRNQALHGASNHRISVHLVGGGPVNADAIGARITLRSYDGRTQTQEVQSGSSLGAGNSLVLHFGLGSAHIDTLSVRWPDGSTDSYRNLAVDREYTIHYQAEPIETAPAPGLVAFTMILLLGALFAFSTGSDESKPQEKIT